MRFESAPGPLAIWASTFGLPGCSLPLSWPLPEPLDTGHHEVAARVVDAAVSDGGLASPDAVVSKHLRPASRAASVQAPSEWSFVRRQSFGVPGRRSFERGHGGVAAALAEQRQRRQRRYPSTMEVDSEMILVKIRKPTQALDAD